MVVQHDPCGSTRLQHSPRLVQTFLRVWAVMHDAIRIHNVKGIVGERQILRVRLSEIVLQSGVSTSLPSTT